MTDRELLERAARAAGYAIQWGDGSPALSEYAFRVLPTYNPGEPILEPWDPLEDDGDALRLAVRLRLDLSFEKLHTVSAWAPSADEWVTEYCADGMGADIAPATRRAIVRAAAALADA